MTRPAERTRLSVFAVLALAMLAAAPPPAPAQCVGSWMVADPGGPSDPTGRVAYGLAYDAARQVTVLFGGVDDVIRGDTWLWDGSAWSQAFPAQSPDPRGNPAMAYDEARGRVVLFGGGHHYLDPPSDETWTWDGTNWTLVGMNGPHPAPRNGAAMAYDARRGRVVLFGGIDRSTDPFTYYDDTWEWDGSAWKSINLAHPPARYGHTMAYAGQGNAVLFGGFGSNEAVRGDLWQYDGKKWVQRGINGPPAARAGHGMAFDPARGLVLLFGGDDGSQGNIYGDTWGWNRLTDAWVMGDAAEARSNFSMAFDTARGRAVRFGGNPGVNVGPYRRDTQELAADPIAAPTWGSAVEANPGEANLAWADNSTNEDGFVIQRQEFIGGWGNLKVIGRPADSTSYNESPGSGVFRYRLQAADDCGGASPWTAYKVILPAAPTKPGAMNLGGGHALVSWQDNSGFESGFTIQRQKKAGGVWGSSKLIVTPPDIGTWNDDPGGGQFRYRIRAFHAAGSSAYTNWVIVTVTP